MSHIDFIMISDVLLPMLEDSGYHTRSLSDHAPCWASLRLAPQAWPRTWRLHPFWLSALNNQDDIQREWQFYFNTNRGTASIGLIWEAFKLHFRSTLSRHINRLKASSKLLLQRASDRLVFVTNEFLSDPTPINASTPKLQTRIVDQLHYEKAKQKHFFSRQRVFEQGERVGKLLAYLAHQDTRPQVVVS